MAGIVKMPQREPKQRNDKEALIIIPRVNKDFSVILG